LVILLLNQRKIVNKKHMKFKLNYIIIPLVTVVVAVIGGTFSSLGMTWYDTELIRPVLNPPKWIFPVAWNIIFVLTTISALITWNKRYIENRFLLVFKKKEIDVIFLFVVGLFIANAVFNVLWSLLFFTLHQISLALFEMVILEITTLLIMGLLWNRSKLASLLLLPYAVWVGFATYLTFQIVLLN